MYLWYLNDEAKVDTVNARILSGRGIVIFETIRVGSSSTAHCLPL